MKMFKLAEFVQKVKEKSSLAISELTTNLIDRTVRQARQSKSITQIKKDYLNSNLDENLGGVPQKQSEYNSNSRMSQNRSAHPHNFSSKIRHDRGSSGNIHEVPTKQLQLKRQKLMLELKEIDIEMKNKHKDDYMSRIKRNKTEVQMIDKQSYERAAKLVEKMNRQRSQMAQKKVKQTIQLKQSVQQSLKRLKQMEQQRREKEMKKKQEIQKRMEARKAKAFEREKINRISNQLIKDISSFKVSLPDIYLKNYQTNISNPDEYQQMMITNVEQKKSHSRVRQSRVTSFMQNVQQEAIQRKKMSQQAKQYHKSVRQKQVQFGQRVRQNQKLKLQRSKSNKKVIHRPRRQLKIEQNQTNIQSQERQYQTVNAPTIRQQQQ